MSNNDFNIKIDEQQMAVLLLNILKKKEKINEPTYNQVLQIYLKKLKEVA